jgi:type 1 glutamine amidotransferase
MKSGAHSITLLLLLIVLFMSGCQQSQKIRALIVTGQNKNHNWETGSKNLEIILHNAGIFDVDVALTPAKGEDMSGFKPQFDRYGVVLLDYDGDLWPEETRKSFEDYIKEGGGLVVFHGTNNAFTDWEAYNLMIGFGGWGDRDESAGPWVYWDNGQVVYDMTPGKAGSHGKQHEYLVEVRAEDHPITRGMPEKWMHAKDELYYKMRGPGENIEVLATAYDDTTFNGGGKHEIVMMTVRYGEGRIFHTTLGHAGVEAPSMECAGFVTSIQRGAEWVATGDVSQPMPPQFPNSVSVVQWPDLRPLTIDELMGRVAQYRIGSSRIHLSDLGERIRRVDSGDAAAYSVFEDKMLELLQSDDATVDCKKFICRELGWMGSGRSQEILLQVMEDKDLKEMARYALQRQGYRFVQ